MTNDQGCGALSAAKSTNQTDLPVPALLSKQQMAGVLDVSPRTLEEWMRRKRVPFLRLSPRMVKFQRDRVLAALGRYEVREIGKGVA